MNATVVIVDVFRIAGLGVVPVGTVKEGVLKTGMKMNISGRVMTVKRIEMHHKGIEEANPGDSVGIALENGDYDLLKAVRNQEVTFSDSGEDRTRVLVKPKKRKRRFLGFI